LLNFLFEGINLLYAFYADFDISSVGGHGVTSHSGTSV
jgi:hypothetical protein